MHAVSENERTVAFFNAIRERDFEGSGELLYASHESLRDRYEVSIPEMDLMVEWTRGMDGVFGARMMGGGFGGCTINMVRPTRPGI
jgi:galactokinase